MLLPRTEVWQIFLSRYGASATPLSRKALSALHKQRQHVTTSTAVEAWDQLQALLPRRCKLYVYLDSDLAKLKLIAGNEALSERDWQTLAQTHFNADEQVVLDQTWHSGKRAAVGIDRAVVERLQEARNVVSIQLTSVLLLTQAKFRAGTQQVILQVRDAGGWTIAGFDGRRCLALTGYPAAATEAQIEAESERLALSAAMEADTKCTLVLTAPEDTSSRLSGLFHFNIIRRTRMAITAATLSMIAFIAVVIFWTQAWGKVGEQAKVVAFKRKQLQELSQAVAQQRAAAQASPPIGEPSELQMDWDATFGQFEAVATPAKGIKAVDLTAKASSNTARLTVDVQRDALPLLYEKLNAGMHQGWRVASVNMSRDMSAPGFLVVVIREPAKDE